MSFSGLPYDKEAQMSGLEQQKHIFFFTVHVSAESVPS